MRYAADHKARTRARIVREASTALRLGGPEKVVVSNIMAAAGLTHGGFYTHFKTKDDLIVQAIDDAFAEMREHYDALLDGRAPTAAMVAFIESYLSEQHRDLRDHGCPVAALGVDASRLSDAAREVFELGVLAMRRRIESGLRALGLQDAETLAGSVMAEMVGALTLARAVSDAKLSTRLLRTSRIALRTRLGIGAGKERAA